MKLTTGTISFTSLDELKVFINRFQFLGILQLAEPVKDNSGSILFAEEQFIKESTLEKLTQMKGGYREEFKVLMTDQILAELGRVIGDTMIKSLEMPENGFIRHLLERSLKKPQPYIANTLKNGKLALILFKFIEEKTDFFYHISDLALICLALSLHQVDHRHMINTLSFMTGLSADLGLMDSDTWQDHSGAYAADEEKRKACSQFAHRIGLPSPVTEAILRHRFNPNEPEQMEEDTMEIIKKAMETDENHMDEEILTAAQEENEETTGTLAEQDDTPQENQPGQEDPEETGDIELEETGKVGEETIEEDAAAQVKPEHSEKPAAPPVAAASYEPAPDMEGGEGYSEFLAEILSVARFIHSIKNSFGQEDTREIVQRLAYNSGRGWFSMALVEPVIEQFREYGDLAEKMIHIASIEKRCIMPPSAWAYPKPNATQIVCTRKAYECNFILTSREINIIDDQEAYGRMGRTLYKGYYPKCKLEELLFRHEK